MPSHCTHVLFAQETFESAFDRRPSTVESRWLSLGAQGPDPFFSALKREPSGVEWAMALHTEGYGRLVAAMSSPDPAGNVESSVRAYIYGYATHAFLDRGTHPWINYVSGTTRKDDPKAAIHSFCHPHLERIIDVLMLEKRRGIDLVGFDYAKQLPDLDEIETEVTPLLARAISRAFDVNDDLLQLKINNAHHDDREFQLLIDPANEQGAGELRRLEEEGQLPAGARALLFPETLPDGDFLNLQRRPWKDPRYGGDERRDTFIELFEASIPRAIETLQLLEDAMDGRRDPAEIEQFIGNGDLSDGSPAIGDVPFVYEEPMPLADLIDALYTD